MQDASTACCGRTATPDNDTVTSRRGFLKAGGGATAALVLGVPLHDRAEAAARTATATSATVATTAVNSWLAIGSDESIVLTVGSSDMGQGSSQALAIALCEDLVVLPPRVQVVQGGPTLASPAPVGTAIVTVGSGVTRNNFWRMRDAAAAAREMLVSAAMGRVGDTTRGNYAVLDGVITHQPSGTAFTYGQLAAEAALLPVPTGAPLVPDSQFRCIGRTFPRTDIPLKVDGSAIYGLDVRVPNMVYAVIRHAPTVGSTLAATPAVPSGMMAVVPVKVWTGLGRGGEAAGNVNAIAVVGPTTWDAWQGAKRVTPQWTLPANAAQLNTAQFVADAQRVMTQARPYNAPDQLPQGSLYQVERSMGDAVDLLSRAAKRIDVTYSLPYIAHATLEVLNCTVDYQAGVKCEVWAPTQVARSALQLVVQMTGLPAGAVKVNTTFLGGGLGRKAEIDFICQAVQVAMAINKPVKLMWPREEDFAHDQYRPMALVRVRAGLLTNGSINAWVYRNVSPSILGQRGSTLPATGDSQGYEASQGLPYNFGARLVEWCKLNTPIPVGFWRSVGASINTFVVESAIDELAALQGKTPTSSAARG